MPQLDLTPVTIYSGLWPYHVDYDNIPILQLINREMLINNAVDNVEDILRQAIGTQGTLANRLDQSINPDGSLKAVAVDNAMHNIGYHEDGVGPDAMSYVRMLATERAKLSLIADEATSLVLIFDSVGGISISGISMIGMSNISYTPITFDNQTVEFKDSPSVRWRVEANNKVYADTAVPVSSAHRHFYDLAPVPANQITPDYQNYQTTSLSTPFTDGSLRVFVNGVRLSENASVYVPGYLTTLPWKLLTYSTSPDNGTFVLSTPITGNDVIGIDFDTGY